MGSCVSADKNSDSAMKFRFSVCCNAKKLSIPSSTKEKPVNGEYPVSEFGCKSQLPPLHPVTSFRSVGSKEESFFDSQAWFESDCEDDFFSVNGDFTPSRGSTPNYQNGFIGTPQQTKSLFVDRAPNSIPVPSPTYKKKRLSELFQESFDGDEFSHEQNTTTGNVEKPTKFDLPPKSAQETPYISGVNSVCSSDRTPNKDSKAEKEKLPSDIQCCLPSLIPSRKSNEKKKVNTVNNGEG